MKDWNDAYRAGVDIRALADGAPMFKPNGSAKTAENARSLELILRCAKDIKPEQIEWLWEGRLARGKRQDNIHRPFSLQTDLCLLEEKLRALGDVRLIEIDPISAYFGGSKKADSHNDVDVRTVLAPVTDMANRLDVAILSIQHFNKSSGGIHAKALHKFMGSIAFVLAHAWRSPSLRTQTTPCGGCFFTSRTI